MMSGPISTIPVTWSSNTLLAGRWLDWIMLFLAGLAWAATPILLARGIGIEGMYPQFVVGLSGLLLAIGLLFLAARTNVSRLVIDRLGQWQPPSLVVILGVGLLLRLAWTWIFPASPSSDGASYVALAQKLIDEGRYETAGTLAYWPPGYPFFLAPWLLVFNAKLAVVLSQLTLYVVGTIGCYKLAHTLSGEQAGKLAALLFAIWPNLIALTGTPEKEILVLALLPWVCFGVLRPQILPMGLAGLALGFATLVQPSLQFLLIAFLVLIPMLHGWRKFHGAILMVICALAVITPWTLRNYQHFGQIVLISTNGGDVLYRANNPWATGGYAPRGELDLSRLGELELDHVSKQEAINWITNNPVDFLKLVPEKQIRFMGDDSAGVYASLKRGGATDNPTVYLLAKIGANSWWIAMWLLIAAIIWSSAPPNAAYRITTWCWLYLFVLHSVFESNGKYHIPMSWALIVWIGCALASHHPGRGKERSQPIRMRG